ncbi:MAG: hypothetical protein KDD60_04755 [Bdellovibrionales bacterium]|nr:hypothetical protein [Bdellovibrionales bacterium]
MIEGLIGLFLAVGISGYILAPLFSSVDSRHAEEDGFAEARIARLLLELEAELQTGKVTLEEFESSKREIESLRSV